MEKKISGDWLNAFLLRFTRHGFWELGINDAAVARYLGDVLVEFARAENLYRVRSRAGRELDSVAELVVSSGPQGVKDNPPLRERALHKYLGDYSLFMSGIFRPYVERKGSRYLPSRGKALLRERFGIRPLPVPYGVSSLSRAFQQVRILFWGPRPHSQGLFCS